MIDIKIDSAELENQLTALVDKIQHREPLMRDIAGIMADAVEENFAQEGRPKWLGIQRDGKVLQDSGQLAASITAFNDNENAVVGTNKKYAAIHQFGGQTKPHIIRPRNKKALAFGGRVVKSVNHPGSKIPARPFLALTDDDINEIEHAVSEYLVKIIK